MRIKFLLIATITSILILSLFISLKTQPFTNTLVNDVPTIQTPDIQAVDDVIVNHPSAQVKERIMLFPQYEPIFGDYEARESMTFIDGQSMMDAQIFNNNNQNIVIESTRLTCGSQAFIQAFPDSSSSLILIHVNAGMEYPLGDLYTYDLKAKTCNKMKVSQFFHGMGRMVLSPNQHYGIVYSEDFEKELRVVDFLNDSLTLLGEVSHDESLNGGYYALSGEFQFHWIDNHTIEYVVYKETEPGQHQSGPDKEIIEVRKIQF